METTRHFVTTVYLVNEEETALHKHKKLDIWLPPGGHIDRDELPHEAAIREVKEETGLSPDLKVNKSQKTEGAEWAKALPEPEYIHLENIQSKDSSPVHQHINLIYYAKVGSRNIDPNRFSENNTEVPATEWRWLSKEWLEEELKNSSHPVTTDVLRLGIDAIEQVN